MGLFIRSDASVLKQTGYKMKIKDRAEFKNKPSPFVLGANDMVFTAIQTMAEKNIGSVVIIDADRKVRGIVTERDLLRRLLSGSLDAKQTPLSAIMTSEVKTASPDDQVIDWLRQMSNERFRHLPVVDGDGRLINLLSQGDFVSYTWPELLLNLRDKAGETIRTQATPVPILLAAMLLYTLAIIAIFKIL